MEAGVADGVGDRIKRQVSAEVALDVPDGSGRDAHNGSIMTRCPTPPLDSSCGRIGSVDRDGSARDRITSAVLPDLPRSALGNVEDDPAPMPRDAATMLKNMKTR